jgi:hypothetical protein
LKIVLGEVGNEAAFLVGDGEQHVHAGNFRHNRRGIGALSGFVLACVESDRSGGEGGEAHNRQYGKLHGRMSFILAVLRPDGVEK